MSPRPLFVRIALLTIAAACSSSDEPAPSAQPTAPAPSSKPATPALPSTPSADLLAPPARSESGFLARSPTADLEKELAHHLMSCLGANGPSVCPWYLSVTETPRLDELERRCQAGDARACLLAGLGYQGRGDDGKASELVARSCDGREALACTYLAIAAEACKNSLTSACTERYKNTFSAREAESILDTECKNGLGVACYALGTFVYPREDNSFFLLREGCRLGVMGSCARLVALMDAMSPRDAVERRRAVLETMRQICAEQPVDCAEGASALASPPNDERYFRTKGCDPTLPLHLPADRCR